MKELMPLIQQLMETALSNPKVAGLIARGQTIYQRLMTVSDVDDEFGMDPAILTLLRPIFEFLYREWWRVEVKGIKNIPAKGPAIIVSNHSGMLPYDAVMINMSVFDKHPKERNVRFLVADFVDNFPLLGLFVRRAGGVVASRENAAKLLKKGELVCAFPEGVKGIGKLYSERYQLQEFGKGGVVKIAAKAGVPVIPCAVIGAEDIHPIIWKFEDFGKKLGLPFFPVTPTFPLLGLLGLIPFPSKWKIVFGKPIVYKKGTKNFKGEADKLRKRVSEMIKKQQSADSRQQ